MNPKIRHRSHKIHLFEHILRQLNQVYIFAPYFSKTHFNIILSSLHISLKCSFRNKNRKFISNVALCALKQQTAMFRTTFTPTAKYFLNSLKKERRKQWAAIYALCAVTGRQLLWLWCSAGWPSAAPQQHKRLKSPAVYFKSGGTQ